MKLTASLISISLLFWGGLALADTGAPSTVLQQNSDDKGTIKPKVTEPKSAAVKTTTATADQVSDADLTSKKTESIQETLAKSKTTKNDKFIPSEEISEDLAVSFPVDI